MKEKSHRHKSKILYLAEIGHKDWDGDIVWRGIFAGSPRKAVTRLYTIFKKEDGYRIWVGHLKVIDDPSVVLPYFPMKGDVREANVLSPFEGEARAAKGNAHERSECCPSSRTTNMLRCINPKCRIRLPSGLSRHGLCIPCWRSIEYQIYKKPRSCGLVPDLTRKNVDKILLTLNKERRKFSPHAVTT